MSVEIKKFKSSLYLLKKGAKIHDNIVYKISKLKIKKSQKNVVKKIFNYLRKINYDFNFIDEKKDYPLILIARKIKDNNKIYSDLLNCLITNGAICSMDKNEYNSLYYVIQGENIDLVEKLIINGIDINNRYISNIAYKIDNIDIFKLLVSYGFKIDEEQDIFKAIKSGSVNIISFFLKNGINVNATYNNYKNHRYKPLTYIIEIKPDNYMKIIKLLLENGSDKLIFYEKECNDYNYRYNYYQKSIQYISSDYKLLLEDSEKKILKDLGYNEILK